MVKKGTLKEPDLGDGGCSLLYPEVPACRWHGEGVECRSGQSFRQQLWVFGCQVLALQLNIDFNNSGIIAGNSGSIANLKLYNTGTSQRPMLYRRHRWKQVPLSVWLLFPESAGD